MADIPEEEDPPFPWPHFLFTRWRSSAFSNSNTFLDIAPGYLRDAYSLDWKRPQTAVSHAIITGMVSLIHIVRVALLLNVYDYAICCLIVLMTYGYKEAGVELNVSPSLLVPIVVFPLAFSVQSAYGRRETSLAEISTIRASAISLILSFRNFARGPPSYKPALGPEFPLRGQLLLGRLCKLIGMLLMLRYEADKISILRRVYMRFNDLKWMLESLRASGLPPPMCAKLDGDVNAMLTSFERLRIQVDYRTPMAIRAFLKVVVLLVSILFVPYFSFLVASYDDTTAYITAFFFPFLLLSLWHVQLQLELPFGDDVDDINVPAMLGFREDRPFSRAFPSDAVLLGTRRPRPPLPDFRFLVHGAASPPHPALYPLHPVAPHTTMLHTHPPDAPPPAAGGGAAHPLSRPFAPTSPQVGPSGNVGAVGTGSAAMGASWASGAESAIPADGWSPLSPYSPNRGLLAHERPARSRSLERW
eukprot:TRINITY_DN7729_c0_g1_i2.p1 TRINITY_DN7729_c0_g1~~TRINITY_DN7729_c0_g1_i2.p1  ORF type:complete len:474 (+),score=62.79 TRINITY_DN7729_c0_g1_i2:117-1538(+)